MAYYLVEAAAKEERLPELAERLEKDEFLSMRPFGVSVIARSLSAPLGLVRWPDDDGGGASGRHLSVGDIVISDAQRSRARGSPPSALAS